MKPCLLIPIYDHGTTIRSVVLSVAPLGVPCLIVDDGSAAPTRAVLDALTEEMPWVHVHRLDANGGKGRALKVGFRLAAERGFSHVVHLDADGQHDGADARRVLDAMERHSDALVLGLPVFDDTVPRSRLYARQISRGAVWAASLSFAIHDPLCGFRGVPLLPMLRLLAREDTGDHMEFEPEVAVRLFWDRVPVMNVPTRIVYHEGGLSHFSLARDFPRLGWLYVRLLAGMLVRAPELLRRPPSLDGVVIDDGPIAEERRPSPLAGTGG